MVQPAQTSPLAGQPVLTILRQHPLRYLGMALVFVAIFSGKFSFDRFVAETSRTPWLELRIWASALACAVALFLIYRGHLKIPAFRKELLIGLAFIVLLHGYFIVNAVLIGDVTRQAEYILDFSLLLLWAFLIVFYFRSQADLIVFSIIAEAVALTLFILALLGWGNPSLNGGGWAPFGGTITFYRIEFLAFCAGLYLSTLTTATYSKGIHLMVAGIGLFSALASLSKAAFIAAFCVALVAIFNLLSIKQYQRAAGIAIITCAVFFGFFWTKGDLLQNRLEQATGSALMVRPAEPIVCPPAIISPPWSLLRTYSTTILEKIKLQQAISIDDLTEEERTQLRALWHVFKKDDLPHYLADLKPFLISINGMVVLNDGTTRLPMALAAWDAFVLHKWLGIGVGNYIYQSFNNCTGVIDTYRYSHNIILEILATTGLVGIVLFLVVIFYFQVLLRQCFLQQKSSIYFAAYGGFIFLTALFSGDIYDFRVYWYVGLIALICFHVGSQGKGDPECIAMANSDAGGQTRSADNPAAQAEIKLS
jgi:hypothetical protein